WNGEHRAIAAQSLCLCPSVVRVRQHVGDMDNPTFQQRASSRCPASSLDGHGSDIFDEFGREAVGLGEEKQPLFFPGYRDVIGITKAGGRFDKRLQYRLEIE